MKSLFKEQGMRVQHIGDAGAGGGYALDVKVTWLTPDMIRLSFARSSDILEYSPQDYFLSPQELARVADHINDVLCR
jgi:hypothetical protein